MNHCGKITVSESNAKADLLNEVFINQNTSLAPDACVFGPSPFNVTFDLGNIYPSDVQRVLITFIAEQDIVLERQDRVGATSYDEGGWSRSGWPSC